MTIVSIDGMMAGRAAMDCSRTGRMRCTVSAAGRRAPLLAVIPRFPRHHAALPSQPALNACELSIQSPQDIHREPIATRGHRTRPFPCRPAVPMPRRGDLRHRSRQRASAQRRLLSPPVHKPMIDNALLCQYQIRDSLFSSPSMQLHARGVRRSVVRAVDQGLVEDAMRALKEAASETGGLPLIGAVPFDASEPARLWLPEQAAFAVGGARHAGAVSEPAVAASLPQARVDLLPHPARYKRNVECAIERIVLGRMSKVVMSRCVRIAARIDIPALLGRLLAHARAGYTFAIDLASAGGPNACLVGASPELLLSKRGAQIQSNPLAGSIARVADPAEDRQRAQALLHSAKDRHEHALVVGAVEAALAPYCRRLQVPRAPCLLATPTMWHLSTPVRGELIDPGVGSLALALQLHPTPAVCGYPSGSARSLIREIEGYERGMFTGVVGWCDASGDGDWAVTLRCAMIEEESATVYAGAGIVAGSHPDAELAETTAKLRTMLGAMGLLQAVGESA